MRRLILAICLVCLAVGSAIGGGAQADAKSALLELEREWAEALIKGDIAKLEQIYADELVYTHSNGVVEDKAAFIRAQRDGVLKYEAIERKGEQVRIFGDAGVVTSEAMVKVDSRGAKLELRMRVIHVYVRRQGRWSMVAHQSTRIGN